LTISLIGYGPLSANATNGATQTYNWPSGYSPVVGDMVILAHGGWMSDPSTQAEVDAVGAAATPSGYTYYGGYWRDVASNLNLVIFSSFRFITGGESAPQVSVPLGMTDASSPGGVLAGFLIIYRGVHNVNHFWNADYDFANNGAATQFQVGTVDTTINNAMVVEPVISGDDAGLTAGSNYDWTFRALGSSYGTTVGGDVAMGFADQLKSTAGSITPCVWHSPGADSWAGLFLVLEQAVAPSVPGNPTITPNAPGGFNVSWSPSSSDGGAPITYRVEHSSDNVNWSTAVTSATSPVNVSGYGNGALRYFRIVATNSAGSSTSSGVASGTTWTTPAQPTAPTVTPNGAGSFQISWSTPSNGGTAITGYTIQVSNDNTNWSTAATSASSPVTVNGYGNNSTRYFRVIATNAVGNSTPGPSTVGTTWNLPGTVSDLSAINNLNGTFNLNWTPPSNGGTAITDYLVEWSLAGVGSWTAWSHTALGAVNTCIVTGLVAANSYDFRIKAINAAGTASTYSNIATVLAVTKGYWGVALNA